MAKYKIAWLPGDGIGVDVMDAARIVLDELALDAEYIPGQVGWRFWCTEGDALPPRTIELFKRTDCCLFGAITSKPAKEAEAELAPELQGRGLTYRSPIVRMRQIFDLYTNLRPCKAYKGNPLNYRDDIDLVIFRENTEDLYSGVEFRPIPPQLMILPKMKERVADPERAAVSFRLITERGSERILRAAFEYAHKFKRPKVTVIHKANVIRESDGLFLEVARRVAQDYPHIEVEEDNVDAMCMWLVKNPQNYGVLVTTNMFGDIVSDLSAQLVGGLGFAPSGNIGDNFAIFEPTHGSAPKYAGQYKVNPTAMLLAVKLMLDWLGEVEMAARLEKAVAAVIAEGKVRTYDLGGEASTLDVARQVARKLS